MLQTGQQLRKQQLEAKIGHGADSRHGIHVDDLAQYGAAPTNKSFQRVFTECVDTFIAAMHERRMQISEKSLLLIPDADYAERLARHLKVKHGIQVQQSIAGEALGIGVQADPLRRGARVIKDRFSKARRRNQRAS